MIPMRKHFEICRPEPLDTDESLPSPEEPWGITFIASE